MNQVVYVLKRAVEVFPRGSAIERYPDSIRDPTSRRSLSARFMISKQLERDGIKVEYVETVVLFFGDDGRLQRDVVLVVIKVTRGFGIASAALPDRPLADDRTK
jgi:hypothetical protein